MAVSVFGALKVALGLYNVVHFYAGGPAFMYWPVSYTHLLDGPGKS